MAFDIYSELSGYKDSAEQANECIYIQAVALRNDKKWDDANKLFEYIKDYKDSNDLIHHHDFQVTDKKDVTCTESGYITYTCSCGETYTDKTAAIGHLYALPTCTEPEICSRCGAVYGEPLGHTDDAFCKRCGKKVFETLTYAGKGDGEVAKGLVLPAGEYVLTYSPHTDNGIVTLDDGNTYCRTGFWDADGYSFSGPINNGLLSIDGMDAQHYGNDVDEDVEWTITIEAVVE